MADSNHLPCPVFRTFPSLWRISAIATPPMQALVVRFPLLSLQCPHCGFVHRAAAIQRGHEESPARHAVHDESTSCVERLRDLASHFQHVSLGIALPKMVPSFETQRWEQLLQSLIHRLNHVGNHSLSCFIRLIEMRICNDL